VFWRGDAAPTSEMRREGQLWSSRSSIDGLAVDTVHSRFDLALFVTYAKGHFVMNNLKRGIFLTLCCLMLAVLSGCVEDARTGLVCPPGTHPGPYGHKCFAD
jgi:hypothetical protein